MITNANTITLAGTGGAATLDNSIIFIHTIQERNNKATSVHCTAQIGIFLNEELALASPQNALNVEGFEKSKRTIEFDYPVSIINGHYVLDLYYADSFLKEYMMSCFPEWDANLLVITTEPIVE